MTGQPSDRTGSRTPRRLRLSLALIRVAGFFVPRDRRQQWLDQWEAEAIFLSRRREESRRARGRSGRRTLSCLSGAFAHAWYLFWREYTVDLIWQDFKYGLRSLRRSRGLIAVAVLTLAIGIAFTAGTFSAVDVLMFHPLPYPEPDRLCAIWGTNSERGWSHVSLSPPDFLDLRDRTTTLQAAAYLRAGYNLASEGVSERVTGKQVSWDFFSVLGPPPLIGRGFMPEEEVVGQGDVVVISQGIWQRLFAGDRDVLGTSLRLDGVPHTIIGVMPAGFWFVEPGTDVWTPTQFPAGEARAAYYVSVIARLNDGVTLDQARQEAGGIITQLAEEYPETNSGNGIIIDTLHRDIFDEGYRSGCLIAMVAAFFLLLIACGNVANLLLTHAVGRDQEVALRGALGAGRSRLFRQFLTESGLVASAGGVLGLVLSVAWIKLFISFTPPDFPRIDEIGLNPRVLLFTAGIVLLTGFVFGLAPALHSVRTNLIAALRDNRRGGEPRRIPRIRKTLVVVEISLALVLLVASALLAQGFWRLRLADMDFDSTDALTFQTTIPEASYPDLESTISFYDNFTERLRSLPGVEGVGANSILPSKSNAAAYYTLPGEEVETDVQRNITAFRFVLPGFFEALDIPLVHGQDFTSADRKGTPLKLVINESMARRHWPDGDPIGQEIELSEQLWVIIGVAADSRDGPLDDVIRPKIYLSALQVERRSLSWVVETNVPPTSMVASIRSELAEIDSDLPLYAVMTLDEYIDDSLGGDLIMAKLMAVVAGIALLLCLGGVYGVMAYSVSQRNQELGIRMALGAQSADVIRMVVRQGVRLALFGIIIGLVLSAAVSSGLSHFLWGVSPFQPLTFAIAAVALFGAGVAATFFPARRATKVDPIAALRSE